MTDADRTAAARRDDDAGFALLQKLIAERHHVLLGRDDPIAMLQTVNELLVQQTADALSAAQTTALTKFCHELELSAAAWKREAKDLGERTLEAARRISAEQIAQTTKELVGALALERKRSTAALRRATTFNIIALLATAFIILGALWLHSKRSLPVQSSSGSASPA